MEWRYASAAVAAVVAGAGVVAAAGVAAAAEQEQKDDYDPEAILYYDSADGEKLLQLKLMDETFIRVTLGSMEDVANL